MIASNRLLLRTFPLIINNEKNNFLKKFGWIHYSTIINKFNNVNQLGIKLHVAQKYKETFVMTRRLCTLNELDPISYERICEETLDSLSDYFDEIIENSSNINAADITYSDGVLTVNLGHYGTYVINRQTPNKQIWLSSPTSGPKRYDYIQGKWVYKHDGQTLHQLLQNEISQIIKTIDFSKCMHSK